MKNLKFALLGTFTALALSGCGSSPESIVKDFYYDMDKGNTKDAYQLISSSKISMAGQQKIEFVLNTNHNQMVACGGLKDVQVAKLEGNDSTLSGKVTLSFKGTCPEDTQNIELIKEDGKWKIN